MRSSSYTVYAIHICAARKHVGVGEMQYSSHGGPVLVAVSTQGFDLLTSLPGGDPLAPVVCSHSHGTAVQQATEIGCLRQQAVQGTPSFIGEKP